MSTFGIKTSPQHTTYEAIEAIWKQADQMEAFDHAWLFDHMAPIQGDVAGACLEGWTALAGLAAITNRLRIGLMVTGNTYRHPAVLAKIVATTDVISKGRLDFGIGAGWNVYEHDAMGIPLYKPGERIRRLDEACDILKALFTEPVVNYDGRYYQISGLHNEPKPVQKPYPPFVIGGGGEQLTLKVVAKHADIWNHTGNDLEQFKHKVEVLKGHCETVGRDASEITTSVQLRPEDGKLQETLEDVKRFQDAGCSHFVFVVPNPYPDGILDRLAEEIVVKAV